MPTSNRRPSIRSIVTEESVPENTQIQGKEQTDIPTQAKQGEPMVITAPGAAETQEKETLQAPAIQTSEKAQEKGENTTQPAEQKGNNVKEQKGKEAKETKEEKATEKMSIYLTPTERRQYRALMRKYEDKTERRLDENKFFRIILKSIKLETLDTSQPEQKQQ